MLTIVTGRSGSGKTEELIKMMRGTENAIYIVPEQYSFAAEKKITEAFGLSGMGAPSVLSFRRLAHYTKERCGIKKDKVITPSGKVMVMQKIVKEKADLLTLFGGSARRGDMAREAAVIATTFKQYAVTDEKIKNAMEKTENSLLKKKLSDCLLIRDEYEKFLENGYRDSDDELEILRRNISESGIMRDRDIFIDSFTAFTPLEYSVIEAMLHFAKSVTVSLAFGEGDEFETSKKSMERLAAMEEGFKTVALKGAMYTASDELKTLEASFFGGERSMEPTKDIRLYRAKTQYGEAAAAAAEVERLCRDEGMRYRDIVIIARDLSDYESDMARVFRRFNIPLFMDRKTPLSQEAAALFALSAIRIISRGWKTESVFSFMKTPFAPISRAEADELENYALAAGVRTRDWRSEENWTMKPSLREDEFLPEGYLEKIDDIRRRLCAPLKRLEEGIKGRKTGREMAEAFYAFLEECRLEEKILLLAGRMTERGEAETALKLKQVYNLIIDTLESFESAFSGEKMNAGEFCDIFSAGLESVEIGVIPAVTDCVCAGSIDRARGHGARAVIIIGANEGKFPASPSDTGIFSDFDRNELKEYGIELPPDTLGKSYMEQSLVYGALTCAKEKLYVSCSVSGGKESYAIMRRIKAYFPNCVTKDEALGIEPIDEITSLASCYETFVTKYSDAKRGGEDGVWGTALECYRESPLWKEKLEELEKHMRYENRAELIKRELTQSRYGNGISTSVSRLEEYVKCPFRYFATVTLSLKERKEMELSAADSGVFLHDFVDMFGKGLSEDGRTWRDIDEEYIRVKSEEIALSLLPGINAHLLETSPRTRRLFANLKRTAERSVTALSEHMKRGRFEPLGYEIIFGDKGEFKPLKIDLPNGQRAILRGRVDRADLLETERGSFVRIIDYKSGEKKFSLPNIYYGLDLQLAVYLTAICENGGYKPAGMLYFKIDDPVIEGDPSMSGEEAYRKIVKTMRMDGLVLKDDEILEAMDKSYASSSEVINAKKNKDGSFSAHASVAEESDFKALSSHVRRTVRRLADEILAGRNEIAPVKDACTYCAMKELCAFDTSLKGCTYKNVPDISDRDALLKMAEESGE